MDMVKNVILVGFMGTGKSSSGRMLATRLGCALVDLDQYIETKEGMTIPEIFRQKGEAHFRALEHEAVAEVAQRKGVVIATGGGTIKDPENLRILRGCGVLICLTADIDTILARTERKGERPLLDKAEDRKQEIASLLESRREIYAQANHTVDTSQLSPMLVTEEIMRILRREGVIRA